MRILGVDPGIHGGLAIIGLNNGAAPQLIAAIDIPTIGVGAKERVDAIALTEWFLNHGPQHAYVERAQAMPRQGSSSGFKYGRSVGAIEATIITSGIPMTIVEPTMWKKAPSRRRQRGCPPARTSASAAHALLARKKDHQRGEAALIALFASRGRAMKKRTAQEQKLADRAYLARAWRNWHRDLLAEALAGVHHDVLERLLAQLKDLHSARALVALISDIDWSVVDRDTRAIALHEISQMIMQVREKSGLPPIDDPLPGQPDNAFRIIERLFESFPPSAGEPAGGKAR